MKSQYISYMVLEALESHSVGVIGAIISSIGYVQNRKLAITEPIESVKTTSI